MQARDKFGNNQTTGLEKFRMQYSIVGGEDAESLDLTESNNGLCTAAYAIKKVGLGYGDIAIYYTAPFVSLIVSFLYKACHNTAIQFANYRRSSINKILLLQGVVSHLHEKPFYRIQDCVWLWFLFICIPLLWMYPLCTFRCNLQIRVSYKHKINIDFRWHAVSITKVVLMDNLALYTLPVLK